MLNRNEKIAIAVTAAIVGTQIVLPHYLYRRAKRQEDRVAVAVDRARAILQEFYIAPHN